MNVDQRPRPSARLYARFSRRIPDLAKRAVRQFTVELPTYALLPEEELDGDVLGVATENLYLFMRVMKVARPPNDDELAGIVTIGARHAELRIPLAEALSAYHIGARMGWLEMVALAEPEDVPDLLAVGVHVQGYRVAVVEQGRRFRDEDFAENAWQLRRMFWAPRLGLRGIMRIAPFRHVGVLAGVGVGGGSLVYANTLYEPQGEAFYGHPQWAELADWRAELAPHCATARRMLGVTTFEGDGPAERMMRGLAEDLGVPDGYRPTPVGVFFGKPGQTVTDPYFDGEGPDRTGCVRCGQCMLGCRYGAKNTLTKNYLWLAERRGAVIIPDRKILGIRPLKDPSGADGYELVSRRPGGGAPRRLTARAVVIAAGTLGTNELLRHCKDTGDLPRISDHLGELVRTNSEAIPAVTAPSHDHRSDIAITSSIFLDDQTHVTNNTYGTGGDLFGLTFGPFTTATGAWGRRRQFLLGLPAHWLSRLRTRGWSRHTVIFTVMQSTDVALRLRKGRGPGGLRTEASVAIGSVLPTANRIATLAARRMRGHPQTSKVEALGAAPTTAHFMGGAVIGRSSEDGVIDRHHRVFGYQHLLVCDGSAIPANVGVNPALTITAMAEAAMSRIPSADHQSSPAS